MYKRQYLSPRPPPKISLRNDLDWAKRDDDLGSTVEHRPVGKLVQQSLGETVHLGSSKLTQSRPEEVHLGSENYYGIIWKTSRTTE